MGNRAVITTEEKAIGVYMHWNGSRPYVESILRYCEKRGFRPPEEDCYGWARMVQVICNVMGGSLSVGVDRYDTLDSDNYDNGTYVIKEWKIIKRLYTRGYEDEIVSEDEIEGLMKIIDSCQPVNDRIYKEKCNDYPRNKRFVSGGRLSSLRD